MRSAKVNKNRELPGTILKPSVWLHPGVITVLLISITVAAYSAVGSFDFINFDDPQYVYENTEVSQGLTWSGVKWAFTTGHASNWHPLTWISHMLDVQLFGLEPSAHHYVNLFYHVVNTLLLFAILTRLTGAVGRSALVAALFALHPLHVESVTWISERKDVLSTFFFMLILWAYTTYARNPSVSRYLVIFFLLALGLMAKPMLVTLPFVLLLIDIWPLKRLNFDSWDRTLLMRLVLEKLPLMALVAISSLITFLVQKQGGAMMALDVAPMTQRFANAAVSYVTYIGNTFWPTSLAILYPFQTLIPLWKSGGALLILLAASLAACISIRRRPYVFVGWFWFIGILVPVIGIVQVGTQSMADRYTYVPLIGLFIVIAWGGYDLLLRNSTKRLPIILLCVLMVGALGIATRIQNDYWENSRTLWERTLAVTRENYRAHAIYGKLLVEEGNESQALSHYKQAIRIKPQFVETHTLLGAMLADRGQHDEAISYYRETLRVQPDFAPAHNNLGNSLAAKGEFDEAISHYERALELSPQDYLAHNGLGSALDDLGRINEAIEQYRLALEINPEFAAAYNNLAAAYAGKGQMNEAVAEMRSALLYDSDNANYNYNFAILVNQQGNVELARKHLNIALSLNSQYHAARQLLATLGGKNSSEGGNP